MSKKDKKDFIKFVNESCHKDIKFDDTKSKIVYDLNPKQKKSPNKLVGILSACFSIVAVCLITIPTVIHFNGKANISGGSTDQQENMPGENSENDNMSNEVAPESDDPGIYRTINFDGNYVNTGHGLWPIALYSYEIDNNFMEISGNFYIPNEIKITDFDKFKVSFNENNLSYIISYDPFPNPQGLIYATNYQWNLNDLKSDNSCDFTLLIDVLPLIENNKLLGELIIVGDFHVFHNFDGKSIQ